MTLPVEHRIVLLCESPVVENICSSSFGVRPALKGLTSSKTFHHGVDLRLLEQKVGFDARLVIEAVGENPLAGKFIAAWVHSIAQRPALRLFLCHLDKVFVKRNDVVQPHNVVAITGNTGDFTTGYHLHLGMRTRNGGPHRRSDLSLQRALAVGYVDPSNFLLVLEAFLSDDDLVFSNPDKTFDRRHKATQLHGPA